MCNGKSELDADGQKSELDCQKSELDADGQKSELDGQKSELDADGKKSEMPMARKVKWRKDESRQLTLTGTTGAKASLPIISDRKKERFGQFCVPYMSRTNKV
jgi:hypothetical protein